MKLRGSLDLHPRRTKAQRLKRVFNIDIETCRECSGMVEVIAYFENPMVIEKIPPICSRSLPPRQQVCDPQTGCGRLTCLAETIKPFTSFELQLPKGQPGCPLAQGNAESVQISG